MPIAASEKAALPKTDIRAVHQALDAEHRTWAREDDSPQGSVKARLEQAWPDSLADGQLIKDDEGRDQLKAMPEAKRSSMFPDPWRTNPVGRFWDRLRGRDVTPRYLARLTKEEQESEQKWRTVGTIRRYILLILTLAQTVVATWYMKTILPYQGWALINPMDMVGQDLWVSFMQLLPYMLQTGIEVGGEGQIFYRRRRRRVKRKSGNIDDFCRRWGSQYSYMVVLDADSVMTGDCLCGLVRLMEANPNAGIIQSSPKASGMDTLYARCQQFATRVYGPLFTAGLHFWQLGESHYWGHNAIIRVKPFIEHCALAPLPGEGSFAGSILSHDFVEAALMRRAGWGVWIAYDLPGSYEELPPNLLDELKRDRRWCHGNLMNFRLFLVKGMHPVHRAVFLTGVMSYLSAPLWFMFLALSTALQVVHALTEPQYFLQPRQLFPVWPQWRPELAIALFASTMVLLFLPKLLSILLIWCKGTKEYGGFWRVTLSLLLEVLFSVLLAPVRMLFHTVFVVSAFLGWEVVWNSPQRDDDSTSWGEAFKRHGSQLLLGLVWAVGMAWLDLRFLFWLAPIVFSLILSPFVSVISSRATVGLRTKRWKLFLIPEEYSPPQVLVDTDRFLEMNRQRSLDDGFMHAVFNPSFNALATAMATARHRASKVLEIARDRHVEQALNETPEKLNRDRRLVLLSDPVTMARLHFRVWNSPERYSSWVSYYEGIKLNPLALRKPDAASQ